MATPVHPERSRLVIYQVEPHEIHYLKFVLEAYEGLATLTTLDPKVGLIQLAVPPGRQDQLQALMQALGQELDVKLVSQK